MLYLAGPMTRPLRLTLKGLGVSGSSPKFEDCLPVRRGGILAALRGVGWTGESTGAGSGRRDERCGRTKIDSSSRQAKW